MCATLCLIVYIFLCKFILIISQIGKKVRITTLHGSCELLFGPYWGIFRLFAEDFIYYVWTLYSYLLLFFKMDGATKLDFSNESNPPPPVNEYKGADTVVTTKKKAFDSNWPFENYRSRLSEAEI